MIGGEEHESSFLVIYGGGRRDDVTAAQTQIGEKYGWTVTKANVNQVIADFAAAMPALKAGRPCELAGVVAACPVEASAADPAGGYVQAQEDAYQDAQCAAIGA